MFRGLLISFFLFMLLSSQQSPSFKTAQQKYARVKTAYNQKWKTVESLLKANAIQTSQLQIYLRAFKYEKKIELWGKNKTDETYRLINTYSICQTSGKLGPKRREGDLQIPEGFYHIDAYNPWSNFYLSMRINYPNTSDKILSNKTKPGGNICIHGNCVTIGCMPITDDLIKELYIFCIEAKNNGQGDIPVTVFPARLSDANLKKLMQKYIGQEDKLNLWEDLKLAYDKFNNSHQLPIIKFLSNGRHSID